MSFQSRWLVTTSRLGRNLLQLGQFFLIWIIFGVSYSQAPLYTSNQNSYFLHGLANSSLGFLKNDWMANTVDPFPLFSLLIEITAKISENIFYLYHFLLLGLYAISILGIITIICDFSRQKHLRFAYFSVFVAMHSAIFIDLSSTATGIELGRLLQIGVADQYALGQIFQPSMFGVLVFLSIFIFLRRKPFLAVLLGTIPVMLHFSYLLSAAALTISYMFVTLKYEKNAKRALLIAALALLLVSPILVNMYVRFGPTSFETLNQSQNILINYRLPIHALPKNWVDPGSLFQVLLVIVALSLIRRTKLFPIMLALFLTGITLTIIQLFLNSNYLALLFPWRTSVFLVPLSSSIIAAYFVFYLWDKFHPKLPLDRRIYMSIIMFLISALVLGGVYEFWAANIFVSRDDSIPMMDYVRETKSSGEVYLIPTKLDRFRLYTGAPIFVDFKTHPYQDVEVLEWFNRMNIASNFYGQGNCDVLKDDLTSYAITHVVLEITHPCVGLGYLTLIYIDDNYGVYLKSQ